MLVGGSTLDPTANALLFPVPLQERRVSGYGEKSTSFVKIFVSIFWVLMLDAGY